jgi:hypothetical protein
VRIPFELGEEASPEEPALDPFRDAGAILAGFGDECYEDAALVLARMGLAARRARGLEDAVSGEGLIIADERAFAGIAAGLFPGLESRLVVGTRFGGNVRSRLDAGLRIAFTPLPLRAGGAGGLKLALSSLISNRQQKPMAEGPGLTRDMRPTVFAAAAGSGEKLTSLADALESALEGAYTLAERAAKDAQDGFSQAGADAEARLAFSAVRHARRGDAAGIKEVISRLRAIIGQPAASGGAGGDS